DVTEAAPDLLSVEHVIVTVAFRPGAQRREVAARAGLREPLAPHLVAAQHAREMVAFLVVGSLLDERRAGVQQADEVHADVRRAHARRLFEEDELLGRRRGLAAVLLRPAQPGEAAVEEPPLP